MQYPILRTLNPLFRYLNFSFFSISTRNPTVITKKYSLKHKKMHCTHTMFLRTLKIISISSVEPQRVGRQHIIWPTFPKNCVKMKKFWARGWGARPLRPPIYPPLQPLTTLTQLITLSLSTVIFLSNHILKYTITSFCYSVTYF